MMVAIQAGRRQHPKATFQESEAAIDARLAVRRVRLLQDVALASQAFSYVYSFALRGAWIRVISGQAMPPNCYIAVMARKQHTSYSDT